ncbi:hypothetical protein GN956_G18931 [Arapaima gigas]
MCHLLLALGFTPLQQRRGSRELFVVHTVAQKRSAMKGLRQDADHTDAGPSSATALHPSLSARRSISMGDFRRAPQAGSEPPSTATTAPSSKLVTPSSSMEFEAARRRLLEVEERQRVIREMEARLEELHEVFVRSEQEAVAHGELVTRIASTAQQGELHMAENSQRLKKGLRFKRYRPTIVFASVLGLRTCLPWPVKLK